MHIRSTFRNYLLFVTTMRGRRRLIDPTIGRVGSGMQGDSPGKSGESHSLRCHVEGVPPAKSMTPCCQEKPLRREVGTRTANRHRKVRRKSSGAGENPRL